jgi:cytoskeleton protein RodZ
MTGSLTWQQQAGEFLFQDNSPNQYHATPYKKARENRVMDSEEHSSAATALQTGMASPGATLRAARAALGLDLAHIAAETRIPVRHLESIEADDFESLPSRAYAIGFSRTFAKAVGLDAAKITDAVRAELADGSMRRTVPSSAMEPGDPARLPSTGLAWAAAAAALVLAIGVFAFYNSYFAAGTEPGPLPTPDPATTATPAAPAPVANAVAEGPVVLTALEDGVWVRLYEEGGERLTERTLLTGESLEVPVTATDPRINTGRPDALSVTMGGQPIAKLSDRRQTISGMAVSAAALAARTAVSLAGNGASPPEPVRRPAAMRAAAAAPDAATGPAPAAPISEPASASEPAAVLDR